MLEILGTVFGSIFGGGATGLIGVGVQRYFDYLKVKADIEMAKVKFDHERGLRELDAAILEKEWAGRTRVAEVEAAGKADVAESEAFAASFRTEPTRYSEGVKPGRVAGFFLVLVDVIRGIVRPGLTVYLCALTTLVYWDAQELINKVGTIQMTVEEALRITSLVVGTVLYLTTTCVLWWFGTRNKGTPPK